MKCKLLEDEYFCEALFTQYSREALSRKKLRALGQLFNHYDVSPIHHGVKNGTEHFLFIAHEIYKNFGGEKFAICKHGTRNKIANYSFMCPRIAVSKQYFNTKT